MAIELERTYSLHEVNFKTVSRTLICVIQVFSSADNIP